MRVSLQDEDEWRHQDDFAIEPREVECHESDTPGAFLKLDTADGGKS
jgi:hypothetical protein